LLMYQLDLTKIELLMQKYNVFDAYQEKIEEMDNLVQIYQNQQGEYEYAVKAKESELDSLRLDLRVCPLCDAPLIGI
jgi:hypothetical protein